MNEPTAMTNDNSCICEKVGRLRLQLLARVLVALLAATIVILPASAETAMQRAVSVAEDLNLPVVIAARDRSGTTKVKSALSIKANDAEPLVDLGSITKTVTAIATLHLIDEMNLSPQATLGELLADVPSDKAGITLHQLLTHTSGLIECTGDDDEDLSRSAFLARVFSSTLIAKPGTEHLYSNAGYSVLGAVIEIASGMGFEDYLIERVIPRGLPLIGYGKVYIDERSILSERTWQTRFQRLSIADASWGGLDPGWNLIGNGGLVTSAEGFLPFWSAFMDGEVVGKELVNLALSPHVDEGEGETFYGYGLVVEQLSDGSHVYWHDGGNDLFSAEWRHFEKSGLTVFTAGTGNAAFEAMKAVTVGKI
ncbi:MAG: serine hydrolase [Pseudomonadota bacterium]